MMIHWAWSVALTIIGVGGMYIVGNKHRWGFLVNLGGQVLWLTYAVTTQQWGFIPASFLWAWVYFRNWREWGKR